MGHPRKIRTVLAFSAVIAVVAAGLPAAPASALPPVAQETQVNASGCPVGVGVALAAGEHCVSWPVSFFPQMNGNDKGCGEALFMLVPLNASVDEYVAVWSWDTPAARAHPWTFTGPGSGPYAEEAWSTKALTPQNTGVNVNYQVPAGFGAWFVAAGGGPGPCKAETGSAEAWAVTYRREVSGQLTVQGSGGLPAPGVTVQALCPGGGTTTTDKDGDYEFLLDKGTCTIAPQLKPGDKSTPEQRVVDVTDHSIYNVDFQVPCDAIAVPSGNLEAPARPAGEVMGTLRANDQADDLACPLIVTVQQLQPLRSGLGIDDDPRYGPVNFTVGTASSTANAYTEPDEAGQRCVSGCANLLVTVTNALTHKPVEGATVDASLSRTAGDTRAQGAPYGNEFLCVQSDKPVPYCAAGLSHDSDAKGHVHLIYWPPGVSPGPTGSEWSATLKVTALKCNVASCPVHKQYGEAKPMTLTAQPYEIYQHTGELSPEIVKYLVELAEDKQVTLRADVLSEMVEQMGDNLLKALEAAELAAQAAALKVVVHNFEAIHITVEIGEAFAKFGKQFGLIASLLLALDLPGTGLGDEPFEDSAPADPSYVLQSDILHGIGNVMHIGGEGGAMWDDALALSEQYKHLSPLFAVRPEKVDLEVYEVSHCDQSYPLCGPGYKGLPTEAQSTTVQSHHGIQPELCLYFTGWDGLPDLDWSYHFCIRYDAIAFVETQQNLNKGLPQSSPSPAVASNAGTVTNGDFAEPVVSTTSGYEGIAAGGTAIPGWTVGGDGVEAYAPSFMQGPPGAKTEIRLFAGGPGSISQTITTTPGQKYILKWEGAGEPGGGQAVKTMHVFWDGQLVAKPTFDTTGRSLPDVGWKALQVVVTATSPTSTIEFADATPDKSFWGSMVADVSLKARSRPGAGLAGYISRDRRRRQVAPPRPRA